MYQEIECACEPIAADVWSALNCDAHGPHAKENTRKPECTACGASEGEVFECTGCGEVFCVSHRVAYDGEEACPDCALFWAQEAAKKLKRDVARAVEARLTRRVA